MRVLRVLDLYQNGEWYNPHFAGTNAPFGETLQWGRPFDAVLLAIAGPIGTFADDRAAVYFAGLAIGPVLAFLMIPVLSWGTRPFLGNGTFLMVFVLSGLCFQLFANLAVGRADHHGFLAVLFAAQLAAAFRLAAGDTGAAPAIAMGAAGGIAVWANVVALVPQATVAVVLAALYLGRRTASTRDIRLYTAALAVTLTVALLLERPAGDIFTIEFRRLSIVHWTLAAAAAAGWWAIDRYRRQRPAAGIRARLTVLAMGGAVPLAVVAVAFPAFFLGPLIDYDPAVMMPFAQAVEEYASLAPTTMQKFPRFLIMLGPVLIAFCFAVHEFFRRPPGDRLVPAVPIVGLAIYTPMSLWAGRFVIEAQVLALAPWAMGLTRLMEWSRTVRLLNRRMPVRGLAVIAAVTGPFALSVLAGRLVDGGPRGRESCPLADIVGFLTARAGPMPDGANARPILLSYLFRGPELAWRTPYRVVGAPYGNSAALADTTAIFLARTDAEAERKIRSRGIDLILYCTSEAENRLYRDKESDTFLMRIEDGRVPPWLVPVPLPQALEGRFRLFRIGQGQG